MFSHFGLRRRVRWTFTVPLFLTAVLYLQGCDGGLAPPELKPFGSISGIITYSGSWPPADSLDDLRFIAMRFIPADTADFLQLNKMEISSSLDLFVDTDSFLIENVIPGGFFYSGVAQKFSIDLLAWRPVGLVEENGGIFEVEPASRTVVSIHVDFDHLPPFPPESQ
ncbi:MAG: hypothetical protein E2O84_02145 [Bacteroidetes bacterium]|nr:MAG: hypothetical protein E2O84_02145 [Bacteroidota bacterium]